MRLLDLFCGAGGASMGYWEAGFEVVGVDIRPQPNYPFDFMGTDALWALDRDLSGFDVIHASPPCQLYTSVGGRARAGGKDYPDLIGAVRERLHLWGGPYVIENVLGSPLVNPVQLCGSSFGLRLRRHRLFESNVALPDLPCDHEWQRPRFQSLDGKRAKAGLKAGVIGVHGNRNYAGEGRLREIAMGIDWMSQEELAEAIPPAYTRWLGRQLLKLTAR